MNKLPVFATLSNAVAFIPLNLVTIVRLTWFPLLMLSLVQFGISFWQLTESIGTNAGTHEFSWYAAVAQYLLELIAIAVVAVSLHRVILFGERRHGEWLYFPFGKTELWYVAMAVTVLILSLLVTAFLVNAFLFAIGGGIWRAGDLLSQKVWQERWILVVIMLVQAPQLAWTVLAVIYGTVLLLMVRLAAWPPALVAEGGFALSRAWVQARGNFMRYLGLFLLTFLFVAALDFTAYMVLSNDTSVSSWFMRSMRYGPEKPFTDMAQMFQWERDRLPYTVGLELLRNMFGTAFGVALLSYAYKGIKGYDMHAPIISAVDA